MLKKEIALTKDHASDRHRKVDTDWIELEFKGMMAYEPNDLYTGTRISVATYKGVNQSTSINIR